MSETEKRKKAQEVLSRYLPPQAVEHAVNLWFEWGFYMKVSKSRKSKRGDFTYDPTLKRYTITVNGDLNPYSFLITYLHELAHLITHKTHGNKVLPHGKEWKANFSKLIVEAMKLELFHESLDYVLQQYLTNPKATTHADQQLELALRKFDINKENTQEKFYTLFELSIGEQFYFKERTFIKLEVKRTRSLCLEVKTNRKYLISNAAEVQLL